MGFLDVFTGKRKIKGPAPDRLGGGPPVQLLRPRAPGDHPAVEVDGDDGARQLLDARAGRVDGPARRSLRGDVDHRRSVTGLRSPSAARTGRQDV